MVFTYEIMINYYMSLILHNTDYVLITGEGSQISKGNSQTVGQGMDGVSRMSLMQELLGTNPLGELTRKGCPHKGQNLHVKAYL